MRFDAIDPTAQIKLVAVDMDGTFLDPEGNIPQAAWAVIDQLHRRGITFAPASGRQHARLAEQFAALGPELTIIAENGTVVMRGETEVYSNVIDPQRVEHVIRRLRDAGPELDAAVVRCGRRVGYLQQPTEQVARAVAPYYARTESVPDLLQVRDETIKLAIHSPANSAAVAKVLEPLSQELQVVISGPDWVDVMNLGVHKGIAVRRLQESLGIGPQQTAVFGDYLNDLQMLQAATYSFAMHNAHPTIRQEARFTAPPNSEYGVLQVLQAYLAGAQQLLGHQVR